MNGRMNEWMHGWVDEWMDRWMDWWMNLRRMHCVNHFFANYSFDMNGSHY